MESPASVGAPDSRLFTGPFIALAIADLAYFTSAGMLILLTPLFARGPLGADPVGIGIAVGAFSVTALALRPWSGRESDRRGRRPLLIAGALLAAVAILAHTVVTNLAVLVVLRLVLGAAEALFFVAGFAMLADLAPRGREGEALSFNSLALYLGIAFGPVVGEILLDIGGFGVAWVGAAALAGVAALLSLRLPVTGRHPDARPGPMAFIHRGALWPSAGLFTGVAAMAGFLSFVAIYGEEDLAMSNTGLALLVYGLIVVGCRIVFAKLPDRVPPFRLASAALVLIAAGLAVCGLVATVPGLFAGTAVMAVGVAFVTPAFFAAIARGLNPSERGAAFGTVSIFLDLAFGGGPVVLGLIVDAASIPAAFLATALIPATGAILTAYAAFRTRGG
ncbi:MAG TPA: MFS transporter [Candidatus Limnocylindrales bacterium]|nr:MFS transporter [Candidatus Limnocylindrales bacterium]